MVITGGRSATGNLDDRGSQASATARTALSDPPPAAYDTRPPGAADPSASAPATVGVSVGAATGVTGDPMIATGSLVNFTPAASQAAAASKGVLAWASQSSRQSAPAWPSSTTGEGPTPYPERAREPSGEPRPALLRRPHRRSQRRPVAPPG